MFRLRCDETGDRSLDRAGAQGKRSRRPERSSDRSLRPSAPIVREKDPVEKAEDAGEETGG